MSTKTVRFMNIECSEQSAEMGYFAITGWVLFIISRFSQFFVQNEAELDMIRVLISDLGNLLLILVSLIAIYKFIKEQFK